MAEISIRRCQKRKTVTSMLNFTQTIRDPQKRTRDRIFRPQYSHKFSVIFRLNLQPHLHLENVI